MQRTEKYFENDAFRKTAAGVILASDDPRSVLSVITLSQASYRKMKQNLWWAAGYNLIAVPLAAGALAGFGLERLAFRPFRRFRDEASLKSKAIREATLLSSLAVSIIVREFAEKIFGSNMQSIPQEYLLLKPIQIGSLNFADGQFLIFGLSVVMLGGLQWLL